MKEDWIECKLEQVCSILDNLRKPINATERRKRIEGKSQVDLYPYFGATGQVGFIDDYLTDGEFIVIGEDGAPFLDMTRNVAYKIAGKTWVNNHAHILNSHFNNDFLLHYLNQMQLREYVTGTTRLKLTQSALKRLPLKVPPLPIQRAIVTKIENLFTSLDKGIEDLKKAQDQLKIYRQSVLKKAFEGELTKEWREKQTDLPTAEELLEQIKEERKKYYEKQLSDWKIAVKEWEENGKEGKKPAKPKNNIKKDSVPEEDILLLPSIPKNWEWYTFGIIADRIFDGTHFSPKSFAHGDFKYITAKNIKENGINLSNITYVSAEDHHSIFARADVREGDILYIKDGATTGIATVNTLKEEFSLLSSVGVFRFNQKYITPKFVAYFLNSEVTRKRMLSNIAGVAITRLTLEKLNKSKTVICSLQEQYQIVKEIESRLSVCDQVEKTIEESLEKAEALRQRILKKAFEGELLSESEIAECKKAPDYEPASILLERIKKEK